jgi:rubredoxin
MGDAFDDDDGHARCPWCGHDGVLLGVLGLVAWLRCRHCGIDYEDDHGAERVRVVAREGYAIDGDVFPPVGEP